MAYKHLDSFSTTCILGGPALNREDRETLAASELWQVDLSWSKEAPLLRELAVTSPSKMTPALAKETITHLRVVDKQVAGYRMGLIFKLYVVIA